MIPHQTTRNQFTFSNTRTEEGCIDSSAVEYDEWAQRLKGQYNYFGKPSDAKLGAWTRRAPKRNDEEREEFKLLGKKDDGGSNTPSPELWKKREEPALVRSADSSPLPVIHFKDISHSARAQTIAKFREEMLDLVRDLPEASYELSLRDLVESPEIKTDTETKKKKVKKQKEKKGKKEEEEEGRRISRSESMDAGGLFLKMSIPRIPRFLGGGKRRSSTVVSSETCAKVSPKPTLEDGEKNADREWWSVEFAPMISSSGSSNSTSSSGSSNSNSSSSSSSSNRKLKGCYSFLPSTR